MNIFDMSLESLKTTEAFVINKREISGEEMRLSISRNVKLLDNNYCSGTCVANMFLISEEDLSLLERTFCIKVSISGEFKYDNSENNDLEDLKDSVFQQLLPHLRAVMASVMSSAGLTPYLIPNNMLWNN